MKNKKLKSDELAAKGLKPPFKSLQDQSLWGKILCQPRWFWKNTTYVREHLPGEIKGKLNLKFAKKQKVKALKAAQSS